MANIVTLSIHPEQITPHSRTTLPSFPNPLSAIAVPVLFSTGVGLTEWTGIRKTFPLSPAIPSPNGPISSAREQTLANEQEEPNKKRKIAPPPTSSTPSTTLSVPSNRTTEKTTSAAASLKRPQTSSSAPGTRKAETLPISQDEPKLRLRPRINSSSRSDHEEEELEEYFDTIVIASQATKRKKGCSPSAIYNKYRDEKQKTGGSAYKSICSFLTDLKKYQDGTVTDKDGFKREIAPYLFRAKIPASSRRATGKTTSAAANFKRPQPSPSSAETSEAETLPMPQEDRSNLRPRINSSSKINRKEKELDEYFKAIVIASKTADFGYEKSLTSVYNDYCIRMKEIGGLPYKGLSTFLSDVQKYRKGTIIDKNGFKRKKSPSYQARPMLPAPSDSEEDQDLETSSSPSSSSQAMPPAPSDPEEDQDSETTSSPSLSSQTMPPAPSDLGILEHESHSPLNDDSWITYPTSAESEPDEWYTPDLDRNPFETPDEPRPIQFHPSAIGLESDETDWIGSGTSTDISNFFN